jgi:hypothetical protein
MYRHFFFFHFAPLTFIFKQDLGEPNLLLFCLQSFKTVIKTLDRVLLHQYGVKTLISIK